MRVVARHDFLCVEVDAHVFSLIPLAQAWLVLLRRFWEFGWRLMLSFLLLSMGLERFLGKLNLGGSMDTLQVD
jgi:hypothetical protein